MGRRREEKTGREEKAWAVKRGNRGGNMEGAGEMESRRRRRR
jgi:hypothetical protein